MKGRYNGCIMSVYGSIIPGASRLASIPELSRRARQRLKWFDYYNSRSHNARLTCRHFDISPQTFCRWKRRYDPYHLESLENRSCRPKHLRQPAAPVERSHRTHTEEFYEVTESSFDVAELREELLEWEHTYNAVKPHQSLNYLTPLEFLQCYNKNHGNEVMCH